MQGSGGVSEERGSDRDYKRPETRIRRVVNGTVYAEDKK